jgi:formylmethanofuran dehydrogenase subunit A
MPYKVFVNGFPLNASELNQYLMQQSIATFVDSTARSAAIETPVEGQVTYLTGTNVFQYYNGSAWVDLLPAAGTVSDKSANYSIVAGDAGNTIRSTGSAITITVDNVLSVGQRIDFAQFGSGQITFSAGSGVTLNSKGGKLKTAAQYSGATVQCVASGVYWLVGDLG